MSSPDCTWCAEIDNPYFIKLHQSVLTANNSNLFFIGSYAGYLTSIDNDSKLVSYIQTPFKNIGVCGSSNGLLLLKLNNHNICLFNPSTRKYFVLPDMPERKQYTSGAANSNEICCLGYEAIHDDYKVFAIQVERSTISRFRIYTMKSNSWRMIKDFAYGDVPSSCDSSWGSYINGALHSIHAIKDPVNSYIVGRQIIALDVEAEACRFMPLPESFDEHSLHIMMDVIGGYLCVFNRNLSWDSLVEIWVIKEYGVKESWTMLISVLPPDGYSHVDPIFYSEIHNELVLCYDGWKFIWYDLKMGTTREFVTSAFAGSVSRVVACVRSLLPVDRHSWQD